MIKCSARGRRSGQHTLNLSGMGIAGQQKLTVPQYQRVELVVGRVAWNSLLGRKYLLVQS
jgi:hypothetical protein